MVETPITQVRGARRLWNPTGSIYAPWDHFAEWKKINSEGEVGVISLETALRGTCDRYRLLDLVENFVTYTERPGGLVKAVAKNHQYLGVNNAIEALHTARAEKSSQLGVFWHTQGSGKSLSNLWFTQKVLRKLPGNWTFVEVTDRKELDDQIYEEFVDSGVLTTGENVHAETSDHLRELLGQDHRYVFTLIHKFVPPEKAAAMPVCPSATTSSSSPTRLTAPSTTSSPGTCARPCPTPRSLGSPAHR